MSDAILVALISGGLSFAGVIVTNMLAAKKGEAAIKTAQAVMDAKLEELTREVREHNRFALRMPVVEEQINTIKHRIGELEGFHRPMS